MKIQKTLMIILGIMVLFMPIMASAKCEDYSASECPKNSCKVDGESCVNAYVGEGFCQETNVINALRVVGYFLFIAKIIIPFIIVGFGIFDLAKAVMGGEADKLTKQLKTLGIRVVIGILVFALPAIVDAILDGVNDLREDESGYSICQTCLLDPFACENGEPTDIYDSGDIFVKPSGTIGPTDGTTSVHTTIEATTSEHSTAEATTSSRTTKHVTTASKVPVIITPDES